MAEQEGKTKYDEAIHLHGPIVETMHEMGYDLLLDGKTFYMLGHETDLSLGIKYDMRQAYDIHAAIQAAEARTRADADAKFEHAMEAVMGLHYIHLVDNPIEQAKIDISEYYYGADGSKSE